MTDFVREYHVRGGHLKIPIRIGFLYYYPFFIPKLTLSLSQEGIVLRNKLGDTVFASKFSELKEAGYMMRLGNWWLVPKDGKTFYIFTHGIYHFANWEVRKTDINERLKQYLDEAGVSKGYNSQPIIKQKSDKFLNILKRN